MTRRTANHLNYNNNSTNNKLRQGQQDESENRTVVKKKPVGLVNLGNTCFMNAALQCLSRTSNLQEKLELLTTEPVLTFTGSGLTYNDEQNHNELKFKLVITPNSIIRKMANLLRQMTEGSGGTVNPRIVHDLMTRNFGAGLQHDSHELLRHVLDKLKKDQIRAFRIALMDLFGISHDEAGKILQTDPQKAQELKEWDRKLYNSTVIDEIFGGELLTTRTCLECNTVKTSTEEFLDISLPIRVVKTGSENKNSNLNNRYFPSNELTTINRSIQECFQCFAEPETLSGNNKVDCERCHELKLNKIKGGVPVEQVFPPEEIAKVLPTNQNNNKFQNSRAQKPVQQKQNNQQQSNRKKKRRKTRKEKMAEDPFPENILPEKDENSSNSEPDVPELEKITDEGYAEDYKDSDDSAGASAGDNDQTPSDEAQEEENDGDQEEDEEAEEEEQPIFRPVKPEIPKSTKTACKRQTLIFKPPKNLTIHLKRFTVSARGYTQKLTDHVKFSEYIDIRDYVTTSFPNDDQTSQVSSNSWSFEEMSKEVDVALGGASGDAGYSGDSSDRFIVAPSTPAIDPLKEKGNFLDIGSYSADVKDKNKTSSPVADSEIPGHSSHFDIAPAPVISDLPSAEPIAEVETSSTNEVAGAVEAGPEEEDPAERVAFCPDDTELISCDTGEQNLQGDPWDLSAFFTMSEPFEGTNDMDDEPPPYGVSPTPEEASRMIRENLDDIFSAEDPQSGWSLDYKTTQGIAEWSSKSEDVEPFEHFSRTAHTDDVAETTDVKPVFGPSPLPIEDEPAPAIPLPPPMPQSDQISIWNSPTSDSANIDTIVDPPAIIPLGYSSIDEVENKDNDDAISLGPTILGAALEDAEKMEPEPEPAKLDPNGINYRLYGIVEHGGSLNWGHYVAYVRVDSDWYYISDTYVSKSDISTVLGRDPYILFYERVP